MLKVFLLSVYMITILATNVDWIPNDPDAALPLSADYRKSLRSLCTLITNGSKLPADIMNKKEVLTKMCKKLAADDAIGGGSLDGHDNNNIFLQNILNKLGLPKIQTKWIVAFVVCSLAGAYQYTRPRKGMKLGGNNNRIRTSRNQINAIDNDNDDNDNFDVINTNPIASTSSTPAAIREARLRHFEQMMKEKEKPEQQENE